MLCVLGLAQSRDIKYKIPTKYSAWGVDLNLQRLGLFPGELLTSKVSIGSSSLVDWLLKL